MKFKSYLFTVEGRGRFPMDMLRYDRAVPSTGDDVTTLEDDRGLAMAFVRRVELMAFAPVGNKLEPTTERWRSFGWSVVPGTVREVK